MASSLSSWVSRFTKRAGGRQQSTDAAGSPVDDPQVAIYARISGHSDDEDDEAVVQGAPAPGPSHEGEGVHPLANVESCHDVRALDTGEPPRSGEGEADLLGLGADACPSTSSRPPSRQATPSPSRPEAEGAAGEEPVTPTPSTARLPGRAAPGSGGGAPAGVEGGSGEGRGEEEDGGDLVEGHAHSQERRELLIYAIPLYKDKVVFLPVCPWREAPTAAENKVSRIINSQVNRMQDDADTVWNHMAKAEQGTLTQRLYSFGRRMLESVSAEERLMRGIPKNINKVIIYHPPSVSPDSIQGSMSTMTTQYGLAAVGRAAAATVMLPLAVGVDLIILPGPQVLTYYTAWQLWRNSAASLGTQRAARFITQEGSSATIRVNYAALSKLDKYVEAAADSPEGVLSEEEVEALVGELQEAELLQPLLELRAAALRGSGRRKADYARVRAD